MRPKGPALKPGPRKDGRKAAKDLDDVLFLRAVVERGAEALDAFPEFPPKVVVGKKNKMVSRGLVLPNWYLTQAGAQFLREAEGV